MQLFVIGMHRSGTSALARCLNLLGAYFGPEGISTVAIGENPAENPKGFWERRDIRNLNDRLLHASGAEWDRVGDFSIESIPREEIPPFQNEIRSIILELDAHRPWFVKEPRLCLLFPLWRDLLEMPICIHTYRHPLEVALSLRKRNGFSIPFGIALWERYTLAGFSATIGLPRLIVSHATLLASPVETLRSLAARLVEIGVCGLREPAPAEIEAFIRPELYHQRLTGTSEEDAYLLENHRELMEMIESGAILERGAEQLPTLSAHSRDLLAAHGSAGQKLAALRERFGESQKKLAELKETLGKTVESLRRNEELRATQAATAKQTSLKIELMTERHKLESLQLNRQQREKTDALQKMLDEQREILAQHVATIEKQREKAGDREKMLGEVRHSLEKRNRQVEEQREKSVAREKMLDDLRHILAKHKATIEKRNRQVEEQREKVQNLRSRLGKAEMGWEQDLTKLAKWSDRVVHDLGRVLKSNRWRLGCWLSLKRSDSRSKEGQRLAHLLATRPQSEFAQRKKNSVASLEPNGSSADGSSAKRDAAHSVVSQTSTPLDRPQPAARGSLAPTADVVVCICNALEDVRRCLSSLVDHAGGRLNKLILVNDGSDDRTATFLRQFAKEAQVRTVLLENPEPTGYTKAANRGIAASEAGYVILLNSDAIVTPAWIERLIACGETDPAIGIIGPLSNAASWQSVPERYSAEGDWAVNELPSRALLDRVACTFSILHAPQYPRMPIVNGFCFALKRSVINSIGLFDEALFPNGYGEENDYCLRAGKAGFSVAIADDCYLYHGKSKSYSHETRRELAKQSQVTLRQKYGADLEDATAILRNSHELEQARSAFARLLDAQPCSILFLMNFRGAGGGITSIVQEANGLRKLGAAVQVAIRSEDEIYYRERFPGLPRNLFHVSDSAPELISYAKGFEFVVATLFTSVRLLKSVIEQRADVVPCYYIQDYEPSFFHPSDANYQQAIESYSLIPAMHCFAKTRWLCETVTAKHAIDVHKVEPSIDRDIFFPDQSPKPGKPFVVCAMVRPMTERRSPGLTFEILRRIKREFGEAVEIRMFGLEPNDSFLDRQPDDFAYKVIGVLNREGVARLLREASLFIDASTYQAFGRTGLEAMACRCATILPNEGGISEYALDEVNTLLASPGDPADFLKKVRWYLHDEELYRKIVEKGLETASHYSIEGACRSELQFFESLRQEVGKTSLPRNVSETIPTLVP